MGMSAAARATISSPVSSAAVMGLQDRWQPERAGPLRTYSSVMAILELVRDNPDWPGALGVALTRPPGTPERRGGQDHWRPDMSGRPRRISDDLAWFRDAVDEPELHDLHT